MSCTRAWDAQQAGTNHSSLGLQSVKRLYKLVSLDRAASVVQWLACWPLVPKIAGLNPAEAVGFYGQKNPQHAFLRKGSKAACPMSQICGM
jgi:hypothetical protein